MNYCININVRFLTLMNRVPPPEQQAYHGGLVDKFAEFTGPTKKGCTDMVHKKLVMGHYDGNTDTTPKCQSW